MSLRSVQFVQSVKLLTVHHEEFTLNCMSLWTLRILEYFLALLVKFERGPMSLRSVQFVQSVKLLTVHHEEFTLNCMSLWTLRILEYFSALLVKFERGPMSLWSAQLVLFFMVRKEEFTVRKLHVIIKI